MTRTQSKYKFYQEASLSQKLADKIPIYQQLAGSDPETSKAIGIITVLGENDLLDLDDPNISLVLDILNVTRQALFATSDKVNEISKMGMQMPKPEDIISSFDEDE